MRDESSQSRAAPIEEMKKIPYVCSSPLQIRNEKEKPGEGRRRKEAGRWRRNLHL